MDSNLLSRSLSNAKTQGIEWIGLREVRETTTLRYARDGHPDMNETSNTHGVMVEVLAQGQIGYASTAQLTEKGIHQAIEHAHLHAKKAAPYSVFKFTPEFRPVVKTKYATPVSKPLSSLSAGDLNSTLVKITTRMKTSPKIIRTTAFAQMVDCEIRMVSTSGSDAEQKFSLLTLDFEATGQDGSIVQRRSDGGLRGRSYQGGWELFPFDQMWDRVDRVASQTLELLSAEQCPTGTMDLVLMPDQMMLQIHESIGHPLELDRILGDERNYAGWSFVKPADFGTLQYGSSLMNVSFDPTIPTEFATYAFDDIGNPARKEFLIEKGKLLRGLGSLESQARSGLKGVANARSCSWNRPPIDRMANLNLEPGTSSMNEIIQGVERGVLMESNRSWSIDDFRNKFQFGCEYGRLIEKGKLTKVVRNPNYRGVTVPFWNNLKAVGNRDTFGIYGTPYCGKGEPNQIIRVGHASPVCRFGNVEVFGGAQ